MKTIQKDGSVIEKHFTPELNGTHLQGRVDISYSELVATFGEPTNTYTEEGDKQDVEWTIDTPAGIASIYNYKDGKNYNGAEGTETEKITDWHIGGMTKDVVLLITKALGLN